MHKIAWLVREGKEIEKGRRGKEWKT